MQETEGEKALRAPQAAGYAGMVFAILFTISMVLIRRAMPVSLDEAVPGSARSVIIGLNLLPFAGIAFLWFVGVIRDNIGVREDRFYRMLMLGSGVLFIAMLFVMAAIVGGMVASVTAGGNTVVNTSLFLYARETGYVLLYVYAARMAAVFMISTTSLSLHVNVIPRWLAYLGYVFALALLISISRFEWILLLFPVWVMVFSLFILSKRVAWRRETAAGSS